VAKPEFSAAALDRFIESAFPLHGPLRPLTEGEESRAFAFDAGEEAFAVRVNATIEGFEMDRLICAALSGSAIPVPDVVLIASLEDARFACVSRRLPGDTLQALPKGGAFALGSAIAQTLDQIAGLDDAILRCLAASPLMGAQASWPDFIATVARLDWRHASAGARTSIDRWTDLVDERVDELPQRRGLVHGDFGSNNVLVQEGTVSAVLDWSEARIGDPLYDVANILFWRSWLDCMEQQCRYFEQREPWRLAEREILTCYQLRIGLETLHEAFADDDARLIDWAIQRCSEIAARA
jgi:hygromycin-B 4-O-kinase